MSDRSRGFATRAVHAGGGPDPTTDARAVPIYPSSSSVFEDTANAASLFALQKYETIHSRILDDAASDRRATTSTTAEDPDDCHR